MGRLDRNNRTLLEAAFNQQQRLQELTEQVDAPTRRDCTSRYINSCNARDNMSFRVWEHHGRNARAPSQVDPPGLESLGNTSNNNSDAYEPTLSHRRRRRQPRVPSLTLKMQNVTDDGGEHQRQPSRAVRAMSITPKSSPRMRVSSPRSLVSSPRSTISDILGTERLQSPHPSPRGGGAGNVQ